MAEDYLLGTNDDREHVETGAWWETIKSCCLQEDDFWWLVNWFRRDYQFRQIFFKNLSVWFMNSLWNRLSRGSVNILIYGQQRTGKSYTALYLASKLDPTFTSSRVAFELRDLRTLLDAADAHQFFVCDEIRPRFGHGAKWEITEISNFIETKAKTGTSIIFCTPVIKLQEMLYGVNYTIEMWGYNPNQEFSLGLLYSHRHEPLGWILPGKPDPALAHHYETSKDQFLSVGSDSSVIDGYVDELQHHPQWHYCQSKTDFKLLLTELHSTMPQTLQDLVAHKAYLARKGATDTGERKTIVSGEYTEDLFSYLLSRANFSWKRNTERNKSIVKKRIVDGIAEDVIARQEDVGPRMIRNIMGEASRALGESFEMFVAANHPEWQHLGGQGLPDFVNHEYGYIISCKLLYGDKSDKRPKARRRSSAERKYQEETGYPVYVVVYWADTNEFEIFPLD